ncbi:MAG: hypothetical protein ACN6O0_19745, partial [Achromobacter spanius]
MVPPPRGGIRIESFDSPHSPNAYYASKALHELGEFLARAGLRQAAICCGLTGATAGAHAWLQAAFADAFLPQHDTTALAQQLGLRTETHTADLDREILLAMLASPVAFTFPNVAELASAVRIRRYIVQAARKTALAFDTEHAER